ISTSPLQAARTSLHSACDESKSASRLTVSDEVSKRRRISPMPTPLRHVIAAAIVTGLVAMLATPTAQSPTAFGVPSTAHPPTGWTPELFTKTLGVTSVPNSGVNAATVPGAISGYDALLKRFGTVSFKEAFERAARIAEEGWGLAERRHSDLRGATNGLRNDP